MARKMKKESSAHHMHVMAHECACSPKYGKCGGAAYGLGIVGAAIYYISTAGGFWMGVLGLLKALVWPAFVVYEVLRYLWA